MLDNVVGRPSPSWRRRETYAVLLFALYCIFTSSKRGPRFLWIRPLNRALQRFTPWQVMAATLSALYALRNFDKLFGLDASDHYSGQLYAREYNRATWIVTGLDAGFATAMSIRPKWLRDICSIVFSVYYIFRGDEALSKIHRLRELCTLDMLRITWDKTNDNPYLRAISAPFRPHLPICRRLKLPRPKHSTYSRPISVWLFFAGDESELEQATELVLDLPGGGFVAMSPAHHEERLRAWAKRTRRPVLSVDYGKAPEFPYPYAIEEGFDLYCTLAETAGRILGMSGTRLDVILSGDSAGGNIAVNVMFKIIEAASPDSPLSTLALPRPVGLALVYASLNFSFGSWAWPNDATPSPSSVTLNNFTTIHKSASRLSTSSIFQPSSKVVVGSLDVEKRKSGVGLRDDEVQHDGVWNPSRNVVHHHAHVSLYERQQTVYKALGLVAPQSSEQARVSDMAGTRLTMSSKAGYMHDRIINPSMAWAMCLLYLGPRPAPGVERDYRLSPLLAPRTLLAALPPLLLQCGARDPLVDDTVLFGGRVRDAKRAVRAAGGELANGGKEDGVEEEGVTMQIFPGWSHGYLQMSALMRGARVAIDDIADWMCVTFERSL